MKTIKRLLLTAVVLIALLAALCFAVSSSAFITKVLIPAAQTEEFQFSLGSADLGLKGSALADLNFVWRGASGETNMTLYVQDLKASYELSSLYKDEKKIRSLSIVGPRLTIYPSFFSRKSEKEEKPKGGENFDLKEKMKELKLPLRLDELHIPGAVFSVMTSEEKLWGGFSLEVKDFAAGRDASLNISGNARYVKGEDISVERLPFSLNASFSFADSLIPRSAEGSLLVTNLTGRSGEIDLSNWHLLGELKALCEDEGRGLNVEKCRLELKQGRKDVASLSTKSRCDLVSGDAESSVTLQVLPSPFWEKLLGDRIPLALGQLETSLALNARWNNAASELSGANRLFLRNLAYSAYPHLPPLDCELVSTSRFEAAKKKLSFERLEMKASRQNGSVMLLFKTLSPLSLDFERLAQGELCSADLAYELRDAELQWLAPFLKKEDLKLNRGTLSLAGRTKFDPAKKDLAGAWQVSLADADLELKEKRYRRLSGEALLEGVLRENDRLSFTLKRFQCFLDGGNILSAGLKGEGTLSQKNFTVRWDVGSLSSLLWDPANTQEPLFLQCAGSAGAALPKIVLEPTSLSLQKGSNPRQGLELSGEFYIEPEKGRQKLYVSSERLDLKALTGASGQAEKKNAKGRSRCQQDQDGGEQRAEVMTLFFFGRNIFR